MRGTNRRSRSWLIAIAIAAVLAAATVTVLLVRPAEQAVTPRAPSASAVPTTPVASASAPPSDAWTVRPCSCQVEVTWRPDLPSDQEWTSAFGEELTGLTCETSEIAFMRFPEPTRTTLETECGRLAEREHADFGAYCTGFCKVPSHKFSDGGAYHVDVPPPYGTGRPRAAPAPSATR